MTNRCVMLIISGGANSWARMDSCSSVNGNQCQSQSGTSLIRGGDDIPEESPELRISTEKMDVASVPELAINSDPVASFLQSPVVCSMQEPVICYCYNLSKVISV